MPFIKYLENYFDNKKEMIYSCSVLENEDVQYVRYTSLPSNVNVEHRSGSYLIYRGEHPWQRVLAPITLYQMEACSDT
jgi:hypothetical protein